MTKINPNTIDIKNVILHEVIGDFSQEIFLCSYNDLDVFEIIMKKSVNEYFNDAFDGETARQSLQKSYPGVNDWQQFFEDLLNYHGGWAESWGLYHTPFKDLSNNYTNCIDKAGRKDLYDLPFRYSFQAPDDFWTVGQYMPYEEFREQLKISVIQRVHKSYQDVYKGFKDKLPNKLVENIDKKIEGGLTITSIYFEDKEDYIYFVLCKI